MEQPGIVYGAGQQVTAEEIKNEVSARIKVHLNIGGAEIARDENVISWFLDPDVRFANPTAVTNLEPLLINYAGSLAYRPDAVTEIPNFFLASDYVKTYTDLATMEGANEAARRAVNGILDRSGSNAPRVPIWPFSTGIFCATDRIRSATIPDGHAAHELREQFVDEHAWALHCFPITSRSDSSFTRRSIGTSASASCQSDKKMLVLPFSVYTLARHCQSLAPLPVCKQSDRIRTDNPAVINNPLKLRSRFRSSMQRQVSLPAHIDRV